MIDRGRVSEEAAEIFLQQSEAVCNLANNLDDNFGRAVDLILNTSGRIVVSGMGKSGLIGQKIAATFASTGTSSFFLHPAEAFHGDLGMVAPADVMLLISYSGETEEVIRLLPVLEEWKIPVIAMVGNTKSTLGTHAQAVLDISVTREVCPNNLAPTSSTLTTLAMGDALAVSLIRARDFKPVDFARYHPGGSLGRRLLTRVRDVMRRDRLPVVSPEASVRESLLTITSGRLGMALVMKSHQLLGIVTDGDLRRALQRHEHLLDVCVSEIMTPDPKTVSEATMLVEAETRMRENKIKVLVVLDEAENVSGILEIFDE